MRKAFIFLVILGAALLAILFVASLRPSAGPRLIIASQDIAIRFRFPSGWSESNDGIKRDLQPDSLWSPAFVDTRGRYITFYLGSRGDTYWKYLFEFRNYERSENVLVDGKAAKLWLAKDGSFVVTMTAGSDPVADAVGADSFLAVAGNGRFSQDFVRDLLAQLTVEMRLLD